MRGGVRFPLRITEMVPDVLWAEQGSLGPMTADLRLGFDDAVEDGVAGTRVLIEVRVRGRGAFRPAGWLATGVLSAAVRVDLPRLVRVLEAR